MPPTSSFTDRTLLGLLGLGLLAATLTAADLPVNPEKLSPEQTVDAYLAVLEDTEQTPVRRNFAGARIVALGPRALPRITQLYPTADFDRRGCLATVLGAMDPTKTVEAFPLLLQDLETQRLDVHPNVIKALGDLDVAAAVPTLLDVLPQASGATRTNVLYALSRIADPRTVDILFAALDDPDRVVRITAANGVVNVLTSPVTPDTGKSDETGKTLAIRGALVERTLDFIRAEHAPDARAILIRGLGTLWTSPGSSVISQESARRVLIRVLTDERQPRELRLAAVGVLGQLKVTEAMDELTDVLSGSEDPVLRQVALRALVTIGEASCVPAVIDVLEARLRVTDPEERERTLAERRDLVQALRELTGQSFSDDPLQWRRWWTGGGVSLVEEGINRTD